LCEDLLSVSQGGGSVSVIKTNMVCSISI